MSKVSIIIPVFRNEHYIQKCLDSIACQTFTDWECILVDDGSTDRSGLICDEYSARDSRFISFHKPNGGASSARNFGITKARGEWIAFVDSDDSLLPGYLENLLNGTKNRAEIVLSNYGGRQKKKYIMEFQYVEGNEMKEYFLKNKIFALSAPYGKLYKRNIIEEHSLLFPEGIHMGEDMIFLVRYMNCVNNATLIPADEYVVSSHEGSLSTKYYSYESERKCFELWYQEIRKFLSDMPWADERKEKAIWDTRTAGTFLRTIQCLYKSDEDLRFSEKLAILNRIPKKEISEFHRYFKSSKIQTLFMKPCIKYRFFTTFLLIGTIQYKLTGN